MVAHLHQYFDSSQAALHLAALGYGEKEPIFLRFINATTKKSIIPKGDRILDSKLVERYQSQGFDVYFVVNGGGDSDTLITECRSIFYEHDDLDKDLQRDLWQSLGLPEPTIQIDTGGKSVHSYWVFNKPIKPEQWKQIQKDLLDFADADRSLKNPSRIMRLAGGWYMKGANPGTTQASIISNSGKSYAYDELRVIITNHQEVKPVVSYQPSISDDIPLYQCLTKDDRGLIDGGASQLRNETGAKLARNLIGTAARLNHLGYRFNGDPNQLFMDYCQRCRQGDGWNHQEWDLIWKSAQKSNPTPSLGDDALENCIKAWQYNQRQTGQQRSNNYSNNVFQHPTADRAVLTIEQIEARIDQLIAEGLSAAKLQLAISALAKDANRSEYTILSYYNLRLAEIEQTENREELFDDLDRLIKANNYSINIDKLLPNDLARPITQLSNWLNLKPEAYLTSLITTVSSLNKVGTFVEVCPATDWMEPPQIYSGIVAVSSQKKSPILRAIATKPIQKLQREVKENFSAAYQEYEDRVAEWDECKREERSTKFPDGQPEKPKLRRYSFSQGTTEGLLRQLQNHPESGLLWNCDELAGLFKSANQYKGGKGDDIEQILSMYDGNPVTMLRADESKNVDLDGCVLSILGTIQPTVLQRLMKDDEDGNGQWARFCWVNQPLAESQLPESGRIELTPLLSSLYEKIDNLPPKIYKLSKEAWTLFHKEYRQLESKRIESAGKSSGLSSCYGKAEGRMARLALNLHLIWEVMSGNTPDEFISIDVLRKAISLNRFYLAQVVSMYSEFHTENTLAPHLIKVLNLAQKKERLKVRDVQLAIAYKDRPKPDVVRSWFNELVALERGIVEGVGRKIEFVVKNVVKVVKPSTKFATTTTIDSKEVEPVCSQSSQSSQKMDFSKNDELQPELDAIDHLDEDPKNLNISTMSTLTTNDPQPLQDGHSVCSKGMTTNDQNLTTNDHLVVAFLDENTQFALEILLTVTNAEDAGVAFKAFGALDETTKKAAWESLPDERRLQLIEWKEAIA
jgi:hypothetical protein